jgi:hypothetical protein
LTAKDAKIAKEEPRRARAAAWMASDASLEFVRRSRAARSESKEEGVPPLEDGASGSCCPP